MYVLGFAFVVMVALSGSPYYSLAPTDRPHHDMHSTLKPGGLWGHALGIVGSSMVLLLLLYSLRKRQKFGLRHGRLSRWLDIHIFFGVVGPLLITLHTAMKFGGIVSISYYSMVLVALSGVFGRFVYMQIPRDSTGEALGLEGASKRLDEVRQSVAGRLPEDALAGIDRFIGESTVFPAKGGVSAIVMTIRHEFAMPMRTRRLARFLAAGKQELPHSDIQQIVRLAKRQAVLIRRIAMMDTMTRLLHYWHVFHKPFAYIMIAIMIVHVAVAVSFGYTWVF